MWTCSLSIYGTGTVFQERPAFIQRHIPFGDWWSQAGSNRRPLECHSSALPAELWPRAAGSRSGPAVCGEPYLIRRRFSRNRNECVLRLYLRAGQRCLSVMGGARSGSGSADRGKYQTSSSLPPLTKPDTSASPSSSASRKGFVVTARVERFVVLGVADIVALDIRQFLAFSCGNLVERHEFEPVLPLSSTASSSASRLFPPVAREAGAVI